MSTFPSDGPVVETGRPPTTAGRRSLLSWPILVGSTIVLVILVWMAALGPWGRSETERRSVALSGSTVSISIERFAVRDSTLRSWNSPALANSLATQLAKVRGLETRVDGAGAETDFILHGDVDRRDGRTVITARLGPADDDKSTVWTATYWRGENPDLGLADNIAASVAEAVAVELVRRDLASKTKR